jgi:hypothetical protein
MFILIVHKMLFIINLWIQCRKHSLHLIIFLKWACWRQQIGIPHILILCDCSLVTIIPLDFNKTDIDVYSIFFFLKKKFNFFYLYAYNVWVISIFLSHQVTQCLGPPNINVAEVDEWVSLFLHWTFSILWCESRLSHVVTLALCQCQWFI